MQGFAPEQDCLRQPRITGAGFAAVNFSISPSALAHIVFADAKGRSAFTYQTPTLCACTTLLPTQEVSAYAARPTFAFLFLFFYYYYYYFSHFFNACPPATPQPADTEPASKADAHSDANLSPAPCGEPEHPHSDVSSPPQPRGCISRYIQIVAQGHLLWQLLPKSPQLCINEIC